MWTQRDRGKVQGSRLSRWNDRCAGESDTCEGVEGRAGCLPVVTDNVIAKVRPTEE